MNERNQSEWAVVALGALVGGVVAYVMFTDRGRPIRDRVEPHLHGAMRQLDRLGATEHLKRFVLGGPIASALFGQSRPGATH